MSGISNVNNNKFSAPRPEGTKVTTVVITYSVSEDIYATNKALYDRGASVHYTIRQDDLKDGYLDQYHNEDVKAFHSGKSSWLGKTGLNDYAIGIMLINDSTSPFTDLQTAKLIELLTDINTRHENVMTIVGLGEVAPDRHIAPGKFFPWDKLAEAGFGKYFDVSNFSKDCKYQSGDDISTTTIQSRLVQHGYNLEQTGMFDELTEKVVNVFNSRYNQGQENLKCWSDASDYVLTQLAHVSNDEL